MLTPKKFTAARPDKFQTLESCIIAINEYLREESKVFSIALNKMTDQLKRMKRKQESFKDILLRKFSASEMSYAKFHEAVSGAEKLMKSGVRAVLTRLYAFDEDEYKRAVSAPRADRVTEEKRSLFREYENFINNAIEGNEDVLLKLDRLTLELSKLGDASDIDEMNAIAEIDALIQNARWYR